VSCSWDYLTRSAANLAYNYCLMSFEFVLPVTLIVVCYVGIVLSVRRQAGELRDIQPSRSDGQPEVSASDRMVREKRKQEYRLAKVCHRHFAAQCSAGTVTCYSCVCLCVRLSIYNK